ncbi:phosphatidylinositol synthase 1 (CDP-alcohol phosphatidyltransferase1) [Entomophthora muscae]|uniref:Phosphatidylinositol synthase 1 (CDP-alcohol phosphatidyltransferase1) n=1 Tax=Entomophthora muscae TaxID=34485 RepID=A0ACC2TV92_9FUNG|nr:phosphatidylinositol synthase 1 (CDP-alcohol phosphatidyltransferase1) [Entomophthora muscae]
MVTDRCTTTCLLCYLAHIYPAWSIVFQFLISLDVSSHYMHMYSSLTSGATSHKAISKTQNFLLHAYYNSKVVLFLVCAGNELFFIALYLRKAELVFQGLWTGLAMLFFPVFLFKNVLNVIQFSGAAQSLAQVDVNDHLKTS